MADVTEQELRAIFSGDSSAYEEAIERVNKANADYLNTDNKVKNSLVGLSEDLLDAESATDALTSTVNKLSDTFQVALAAEVAIGIGTVLQQHIKDAAASMDVLSNLMGEVLAQDARDAAKSVELLAAELVKAKEAEEAFKKEGQALKDSYSMEGVFSTKRGGGLDAQTLLTGTKVSDQIVEAAYQEATAKKRVEAIEDAIADKERQRADAVAARMNLSERSIATNEQQKAQLIEMRDADLTGNVKLIEQTKRRHSLEKQALKEGFDDKLRMQELEERLVNIKRMGTDVEVKTARAIRDAAAAKVESAGNVEDKIAAQVKLQAADVALTLAQKTQRERQSAMRLEEYIANLRGDEDERHLKALEAEQRFIEWKLRATATNDDKPGLNAELASVRAEIERAKSEKAERTTAAASMLGAARRGFGPTEDLKAKMAELEVTRRLIALNQKSADFDKTKDLQLRSRQISQLKDVQLATVQRDLAISENQLKSALIGIESSNYSEASKRYRSTLSQIEAAKEEVRLQSSLNSELATSARLKLAGLQADLAAQDKSLNKGSSEQEIRARLRQEKREQKKGEQFDAKRERDGGLIDVKRDLNGNVIEGLNPVTGDREKRSPNKAGDWQDQFRPKLADEGQDAAQNFRKQFGRKRGDAADDNANERDAKAKEQEEAKDGSDAIVGKLDELKTELGKLILK